MSAVLLGAIRTPSEDRMGTIALTLMGVAMIGYGIDGYRKRSLTVRFMEFEGAAAQVYGIFLVIIGLASAAWGVTGIGTWLHWWG